MVQAQEKMKRFNGNSTCTCCSFAVLSSPTRPELSYASKKTAPNPARLPEIVADHNGQLTERIRDIIIEQVYRQEDPLLTNFSSYLSKRLHLNYTYLSNIFSKITGISVEQFFISQRIEYVKTLLRYGQLSLTEIAGKLHYSSVAHLSGQFKKVTGMTPTAFRQRNGPQTAMPAKL